MRTIGERSFARGACVAALVAATLGLAAACKEVELASGWAAGGIEVDGVDDEWTGATTYFEKQDVTVGLLNDEEFLYVSLVTSGPVGRQAMATSLTVWFDPDGGATSGMASASRCRRSRASGRVVVAAAAVVTRARVVAVAAEPVAVGVGPRGWSGCGRSSWSVRATSVAAGCRCRSAAGSRWRSATAGRRSSTSLRWPWRETTTTGWGSGWSPGRRSGSRS